MQVQTATSNAKVLENKKDIKILWKSISYKKHKTKQIMIQKFLGKLFQQDF